MEKGLVRYYKLLTVVGGVAKRLENKKYIVKLYKIVTVHSYLVYTDFCSKKT
jgi:hypothetical protein